MWLLVTQFTQSSNLLWKDGFAKLNSMPRFKWKDTFIHRGTQRQFPPTVFSFHSDMFDPLWWPCASALSSCWKGSEVRASYRFLLPLPLSSSSPPSLLIFYSDSVLSLQCHWVDKCVEAGVFVLRRQNCGVQRCRELEKEGRKGWGGGGQGFFFWGGGGDLPFQLVSQWLATCLCQTQRLADFSGSVAFNQRATLLDVLQSFWSSSANIQI